MDPEIIAQRLMAQAGLDEASASQYAYMISQDPEGSQAILDELGLGFRQKFRGQNPRPAAWDAAAELAKAKAANDAQTGILGWTTDNLRGLGLPEGTLSNLNSAAAVAPVTSDVLGVEEAYDDIGKAYDEPTWRNVGGAGVAAALATVGLIPGAGEALGAVAGALKRVPFGGATPPRKLLYDAPYSNYKISEDQVSALKEQTAVRDSSDYVSPRVVSPEDIAKDGYLLNLVGDRTNVGELTRVGGSRLDDPIILDGGMGYMRGKGTGAWASNAAVVKGLAKQVRRAEGAPVYGTYLAMGGTGSDFANMTRAVAMRNFDPKELRKKDINDFDDRFKAAKAFQDETDDFPGIASPKLDEWLDKSGTRRSAFFDFMDKAEWRDKNFPNVTEARYAIQSPELRDIPQGVEQLGGQSIAIMDPSAKMTPTSELSMPHGTYPVDLAGNYFGGFEAPVPRRLLFPEWYGERRLAGKGLAGDNRAFQMSPMLQPLTDEWLDNVMQYIEASRPR